MIMITKYLSHFSSPPNHGHYYSFDDHDHDGQCLHEVLHLGRASSDLPPGGPHLCHRRRTLPCHEGYQCHQSVFVIIYLFIATQVNQLLWDLSLEQALSKSWFFSKIVFLRWAPYLRCQLILSHPWKTWWVTFNVMVMKKQVLVLQAALYDHIISWVEFFQISPMVLGLPEEPKKKQ